MKHYSGGLIRASSLAFFFSFLSFLSHKFNNIGHIAILENIQQRIRGMQEKQIVAQCLLHYSLLFFVSPSDLTV